MDIPINDRTLSRVHISSLEASPQPDGLHVVGGMCHVTLTAFDGRPDGPAVNVSVAVPVEREQTLQVAEHAILERTHEILSRVASFSVDELETCFLQGREEDAKEQ